MNLLLSVAQIVPIPLNTIAGILTLFITIPFSSSARDKYPILRKPDGKKHVYLLVVIILVLLAGMGNLYADNNKIKNDKINQFTAIILQSSQLADRSLWNNQFGGDRISFLALLQLKEKFKGTEFENIILRQVRRVEDLYTSSVMNLYIENFPSVCKFITSPNIRVCGEGYEPVKGFSIENVYAHLKYPEWQSRARAAYLLRNVETKDDGGILSSLVDLMKEDEPSLLVSRIAFETYKVLTGFSSPGVFDFNKVAEHSVKKRR